MVHSQALRGRRPSGPPIAGSARACSTSSPSPNIFPKFIASIHHKGKQGIKQVNVHVITADHEFAGNVLRSFL